VKPIEPEFPEHWITMSRYLEVAHKIAATTKDLISVCEFCLNKNHQYLLSLEQEYANKGASGVASARGTPIPPKSDWQLPFTGVPDKYLEDLYGPDGFSEHLSELRRKDLNGLSEFGTNELYEYLKINNSECFREIDSKMKSGKIVWSKSGQLWFLDFQVNTPVISEFFSDFGINLWTMISRSVRSKNQPVKEVNLRTSKKSRTKERNRFFEE